MLSALKSPLVKWLCKGGIIIRSTSERLRFRDGKAAFGRGSNPSLAASRLDLAHRIPGSLKPRLRTAPLQSSYAFSSVTYQTFATLVAWSE